MFFVLKIISIIFDGQCTVYTFRRPLKSEAAYIYTYRLSREFPVKNITYCFSLHEPKPN